MSAFLIIVCLCGLLLWTIRSVRVEPYILATGGVNDQWRIVMAGNGTPTKDMTDIHLFQQSLLWQFTQNWFNISPNHDLNTAVWNTDCAPDDCISEESGTRNCALFCMTGNELFYNVFKKNILQKMQTLESMGATWMIAPESMRIDPVGTITPRGGVWRIMATRILTDGTDAMDIVAYATVEYNEKFFPATRGFYVSEFNAYRVSQ